jgi:hypothetical protein
LPKSHFIRKEGWGFENWGKEDRFLTAKVMKMQKEQQQEKKKAGRERNEDRET